MKWPEGKKFALTVVDDTDNATVENVGPVYRLLGDLGIHITKTVWPLHCEEGDRFAGECLLDPAYLDFILGLQSEGFEIAFHGARSGDNPRSVTHEALDVFREKVGHDPHTYVQHAPQLENIYWGPKRTRLPFVGRATARFHQHPAFEGDERDSPYFWGDLCKERITYVRNYGFRPDNVLVSDPYMPYHDSSKPFVNAWFSSSALRVGMLNLDSAVSEETLDQWERDNALIVLQTHLGQDLVSEGKLHPEFENGMKRIARRNGWFKPINKILDHAKERQGIVELSTPQALLLEARWVSSLSRKVVRDLYRRRAKRLQRRWHMQTAS